MWLNNVWKICYEFCEIGSFFKCQTVIYTRINIWFCYCLEAIKYGGN